LAHGRHSLLQSFILALLISAFDWRKGDVVHMINMYGFFSTLAFTTNAFLALRVMYHECEWMKVWRAALPVADVSSPIGWL
jgi:hypothetical protein